MAKHPRLFKQGDLVMVRDLQTVPLFEGNWPAGYTGYIDSVSYDPDFNTVTYGVYGKDAAVWGMSFAECDLTLVQSLEDRMAGRNKS